MKNKSFKTPKKFDFVVSANMPARSGKSFRMLNNLLQNCDSAVFFEPATGLSSLYQKIGRGMVV